ncbi:hypothetical protein BT69DRAFT_455900 [Atractiella rhizophila]|nr:hypothetical protein BT69DRAFT_455900 [Atractiella rhizophila]
MVSSGDLCRLCHLPVQNLTFVHPVPFITSRLPNEMYSAGHGARISLRASTSTEIDITSTGVGRELTYERWRYVGKSSARTPGEDDVCEEGLTFENPSIADSSLTISIQFLGFVNESTLERRQSSADWLKVNGFWTYDLSASSTPTSIPSQPASGSSGSTVLSLAGNHWHLVVATVLCSTIFNLFT